MISRADNQIGDLVRPGVSAAQLVDLSHLYLDISISEIDINKIKIGQEVQISFDAIPEEMYKGEVSEISKVGESIQEVINYIVTCEIINPNESIRPGMTAAVTINVDKVENVLTVLNRAVRSDGTSRYVNVVRNNTIIKIPITLGMITEDRSEVIAGDISEGDMVITNPQSIPTIGAVE
jgi:HlyD family secretion protein